MPGYKIAITGGGGYIGRHLVTRLVQQKIHSLKVLSRKHCLSHDQCEFVLGDLTSDHTNLFDFLTDVDILIHCAGEIRIQELMHPLHVEGTQRLIEAARKVCQKKSKQIHWVQLSSVGAYGSLQGDRSQERVVTEQSPVNPVGEYEITKTLADQLVQDAARAHFITLSMLRPSNVFSADMPNQSLFQLIKMIRRGLFFYIGNQKAVANYVHVQDVIDGLLLCAFDQRAQGHIFNLSNDCLLEDVVNGIADRLNIQRPWLRCPEGLIRTLVNVFSKFVKLPISSQRLDAMTGRTKYPYTKLMKILNYQPKRFVPDTIGELI